jgi:hypothetical protein
MNYVLKCGDLVIGVFTKLSNAELARINALKSYSESCESNQLIIEKIEIEVKK